MQRAIDDLAAIEAAEMLSDASNSLAESDFGELDQKRRPQAFGLCIRQGAPQAKFPRKKRFSGAAAGSLASI